MALLSSLGTVVGAVLVLLLVYVLPGRLVLSRVLGRLPALEAAGLALVVGWMAVAGVTHALNVLPFEILPFIRLPAWLPVVLGVAIVARWGARGDWVLDAPTPEERREARLLGLATIGVVVLYLLQYDRDLFAFTCTHRAVSIASRTEVGALWSAIEVPRVLLFDEENDMHGVVALLSVLPSLLGFFGVRLTYAVLHAGLAGASYVAARRAGFGGRAAAVAFAVIALHPTMLGTPVDDVNHVALLASLAVWATLLAGREPGLRPGGAFVIGLMTALAVGAWHPFLVSLPALVLLLGDRRLLKPALKGLVIGVLPFLLRHMVALGGPFTFESFAENAAVGHAVAGAEFAYSGLLNWPFAPELVRTPGNPLPVLLLLPAFLLSTSGALLAGLGLVGLVTLPRRLLLATLLWLLPGLLLLAPQENWFEIEKLQIATVWLAPGALLVAAGVAALKDRRAWIGLGVAVLLAIGAGRALRTVDVPVDRRLQERWPHLRAETPEEIAAWKASLTRGNVLPRFDVLGPDPRSVGDRVVVLAEELARPGHADRPESPREMGLRLTMPWVWQLFLAPQERARGTAPAQPVTRGVRIDLGALPSAGPRVSAVEAPAAASLAPLPLTLPWSAVDVLAFQQLGAPGDVHVLIAGPAPNMLSELERDFPELADVDVPDASAPAVRPVPWRAMDGGIEVGLPAGAQLRITEILSVEPSRIRRWTVDGETLELAGPGFARHN